MDLHPTSKIGHATGLHPTLQIAFISEHASPAALLGSADAGGQNVYVDELSRQLGQRGHRVDVFTRRDSPELPEIMHWAPHVRVIHVAAGPPRVLPKDELWPLMPAFRDEMLRFVRREGVRYDVVHGHFWMSGWVAAELGCRLDAPAVQTFHALGITKRREQGSADTSPAQRIAVEREIIRRVDRIVVQCPAERAELIADYGADPAKLTPIPAAVNLQRFRPIAKLAARRRLNLPADAPIITYVGRMLPRKDVRNVVRALARLIQRGLPDGRAPLLLIVGGETADADPVATPEIGVLQRLAAELGVSHRVRFAGKQQPDELYLFYGAADVAVTTPWYEPFGLTPLEAMACGRPVIGAAVGGISFTVRDGVTGLLVPPRDPDALADRLGLLLRDSRLQARMGRNARRWVESAFAWSLTAQRTADLYARLLAERSAAPRLAAQAVNG